MSYLKRMEARQKPGSNGTGSNGLRGAAAPVVAAAGAHLERAMREISAGKYQKAIDLLVNAGKEPVCRNAVGVCLLRLGRYDDAIRVFREFVVNPGCTWLRSELPAAYKINFATALLLGGHPNGCLDVLAEVRDEQNPAVVRLRDALRQWQSTLPFLTRLSWSFGRIEPVGRPLTLYFLPGDVEPTTHNSE